MELENTGKLAKAAKVSLVILISVLVSIDVLLLFGWPTWFNPILGLLMISCLLILLK